MSCIARNLKKLRKVNCYTQKIVADYLEITQQEYYFYEKSKKQVSFNELERLAMLFGCEFDLLLEEDEQTIDKAIENGEVIIISFC